MVKIVDIIYHKYMPVCLPRDINAIIYMPFIRKCVCLIRIYIVLNINLKFIIKSDSVKSV